MVLDYYFNGMFQPNINCNDPYLAIDIRDDVWASSARRGPEESPCGWAGLHGADAGGLVRLMCSVLRHISF